MPETNRSSLTAATRTSLLSELIRRRETNAEQIGRYLLTHSDDLPPERRTELEWHLQEVTASVRAMKYEYGELINTQFVNIQ